MYNQVHALPGCVSPNMLETNDAQVGLSEMLVTDTRVYMPAHIYKDCCDELSVECVARDNHNQYVFLRKHLSDIQRARIDAYKACAWYSACVDAQIPTAPSVLVPLSGDNVHTHLVAALAHYLVDYPFVRLCKWSPKDTCANGIPVFASGASALNALVTSERTGPMLRENHACHVFMRRAREYTTEYRCFFSRGRLTAVSSACKLGATQRADIIAWFHAHAGSLPYNSATVDLGARNGLLELIEFNTFGPDMLATAGNFSWHQDVHTLLGLTSVPSVEFRSPYSSKCVRARIGVI